MLLVLEIAMLVMGIFALVRGKIGLTPRRYIYGVPARVIGVILVLTLPLALAGGVIVGIVFAARGEPVDRNRLSTTAAIIDIGVLVAVGLAVVVIGTLTAKPPPPKHARPEKEPEYTLPPPDDADRGAPPSRS